MPIPNRFRNIARVASAPLLAALTVAGCLEQAPTYEGQMRLPPYVPMASVIPNPGTVVEVEDGAMAIEVPFRSEDLGESVTAIFSVDSAFVTDLEYGASVFSDTTRRVEQEIELDEGCHLVQLMLTHSDNIRRPGSATPYDISLAALVYWWVLVPVEEGEVHCPQ